MESDVMAHSTGDDDGTGFDHSDAAEDEKARAMLGGASRDERVDRMQNTMMNRRRFMQTTVVVGGVAATGAGISAAEDEEVFDPTSQYAPRIRVEDTLRFAEHRRDVADSAFYFVDDAGDADDLGDYGAELAPREDSDEDIDDPIPENRIGYWPTNMRTVAYSDFPRGEMKEDADGDDVEVSGLQAEEYDVGTDITVTDDSSGAGGPGVRFVADGGLAGTQTGTFSSFDVIDSGVARRRLFAVVDVESIDTGATVELRAVDSDGDHKAVELSEGVHVIQERLGDLDTVGTEFDDIAQVEFAFTDGGADVHVVGLDVEREGDLSFGDYEQYEDADEDSLETETHWSPSGEVWITDIDTLDDAFSDAKIDDLEVETELHTERLPAEYIDIEFDAEAAEPYAEDFEMDLVVNVNLPNPFDISWSSPSVNDTQAHPSDRYVDVSTTTDDEKVTIERIEDDDEEFSWTDRTGRYNGDIGDDLVIESEVEPGQYVSVYTVARIRSSERDDLMSGESTAVGGPADTRSGGMMSWVFSPVGALVSALGLAGAARWLSGRLGR